MTDEYLGFEPGARALVIGASGGVGGALARALVASRSFSVVAAAARRAVRIQGAAPLPIDLRDETSIAAAVQAAASDGPLDLIIVASGILHAGPDLQPEKSWSALSADAMAEVFAVNTLGPALVAKHALPKLAKGRRTVFAALSARVGSISDNQIGGWHAYRASKAALNMMIKNFAIELSRRNPSAIAVGLHPGTVDTALSAPFQRHVPEAKLFTPERSAESLLSVIGQLQSADSGKCFDWAGEEIAP